MRPRRAAWLTQHRTREERKLPKCKGCACDIPGVAPAGRPFSWSFLVEPGLRRLFLTAGGLALLTVGDGFIYLSLQSRDGFATKWFPLLYVGTNIAYMLARDCPWAGSPTGSAARGCSSSGHVGPRRRLRLRGRRHRLAPTRRSPRSSCSAPFYAATDGVLAGPRRPARRPVERPRAGHRHRADRRRRRPDGRLRRCSACSGTRSAAARPSCPWPSCSPLRVPVAWLTVRGSTSPSRPSRPPVSACEGLSPRVVILVVITAVVVLGVGGYVVGRLAVAPGRGRRPPRPSRRPPSTRVLAEPAHRVPLDAARQRVRPRRSRPARRPGRPARLHGRRLRPRRRLRDVRLVPAHRRRHRHPLGGRRARRLVRSRSRPGACPASRAAPACPTTARSSPPRRSSPATPTRPSASPPLTEMHRSDGDVARQRRGLRPHGRRRSRSTPSDRNIWGVTFVDDDTFYATAASQSAGKTWLVRGSLTRPHAHLAARGRRVPVDLAGRHASRLQEGGRPASPGSPCGRSPCSTWPPATETLLPATKGLDDQADWLDDDTLLYGLPRADQPGHHRRVGGRHLRRRPCPPVLIPGAWSPAVVQ